MMNISKLKCMALDSGWECVLERPANHLLRFRKKGALFTYDIWTSTGTVRKYRKSSFDGMHPVETLRDQTIEDIRKLLT